MRNAIRGRMLSGLAVTIMWWCPFAAGAFDGTLLGAVAVTLQQQSSIAVSRQAIELGKGELLLAQAAFDTYVNAGASQGHASTPVPGITAAVPLTRIVSDITSYQAGVTRRTRSGIVVNPSVSVVRTRDNDLNVSVPSVGTIALSFTVPLMKGRGELVNTAPEVAARLGIDAATMAYRESLSAAIVRSVSAYWDYVAATRILDIALASEARSQTMLDDAGKLAKADEIPKSDVLKYEAKLARDKGTRIGAQQGLQEARAALALALGVPDDGTAPMQAPLDDFPDVRQAGVGLLADRATLDALARRALRHRYDVLAAEGRMLAADTLLRAAREDNRPQLDLTASIGYNTLTEGKSPVAAWSVLQQVPKGANVFLGLAYVLPVSNYANDGLVKVRAAAAEQARLERDALEANARTNLKLRVEVLRSARAQLEQTQAGRKMEAAVFENEKRRYRLGVSTVLDLLTSESQLTVAEVNEVDAQRNFAQSVVRYRAETSTLLDDREQIQQLGMSRLTSLPGPEYAAQAD